MPNKLPSPNDILGTNKLPSPDEILKKKGASQLELKERYSSLDTFINQEGQPLESLRGGDLYTYGGIRYIKLQNKWYRDYDGNFVRLSSGNVAQRERELNTNAKRVVEKVGDRADKWAGVTEGEVVSKPKYRKDDYIDVIQNKEYKSTADTRIVDEEALQMQKEYQEQEKTRIVLDKKMEEQRLRFYTPDVKPTIEPILSNRDWSNVTEEKITTTPKYKTDDYIDIIQNKEYKGSSKGNYDEAVQMMKDDFGAKEWESYNKVDGIGLDIILDTEENSVTELNKRFRGSGIYFEETGAGDQIKVISSADNKFSSINEEVFNLYPALGIDYSDGGKTLTNPKAQAERERLQEFIRNSLLKKSEKEYLKSKDLTYENMVKLKIDNPRKYGETFLSEDELSDWLDKSSLDIASSVKWLKKTKKDVYKRIKELEGKEVPYEVSQELIYDMDRLSNEGNRIINKQNETSVIQEGARVATGYYYSINEEKGNLGGVIGRGLVKGLTNMAKMDADIGAEILPFIFGEDATSSLQRSKMVDAGMSDTEINNALTRDLKEKVNDKAMESLQDILSFGTTKEYVQSENRNDIEKVASFLSESIGTVASAGGNPTLAKLAFFAQSYNAMEDQMKSSEFDELNIFEKKLLSVPYGMVIGYLERLGFKVSTGGSKLLNGIVTSSISRALTQVPKGASIELMRSAINKSVAATMVEAGLSIVGGAIVEGAVEGTQNITEVGAKQLFNSIEGKDYFKEVPDLTTKDGMAKALEMASEDFYYGMLGGLVMGSGSQAVSAVRDGYSNNKLDANFEVLYNSVTDPNLRRMVKSEIKANLANGTITKEVAKEQMDAIGKSYSIFKSMPDKLSMRERREAFNLIREKQIIQKEIEGKDPSLVDAQKKRVSEIDEQLKQISNNATKEPTDKQQAVTAEGGISEYQGTGEGQQEVGQGEGTVGQATVNETDRSDSTIPSQVQEEVASKDDVERRREEDLSAYNEEELNEVYSVGSNQTVGEFINAKYDAELAALGTTQKSDQVATLRAEEQAELLKAIPKIESYKVNGEVDKTLMPKTVLDKYNKIYNKYDKLISPLLETTSEATTAKTETKKTEYKQNLVTPENSREIASKQNTPLRQKIAKSAAMIMRALPGVKIYLHNNEAEMHQALADTTGRNLYQIYKEIGNSAGSQVEGEIHINMENANETTMLHEAFHEAILRSGKSIKTIIDFANGLKNIISDKAIKAKLDEFVSRYDMNPDDRKKAIELENKKRIADGRVAMNEKESSDYISSLEEPTKSDEFLTELGAIMAEAETELTTTKLQQFLNLINRIAKSLGLPVIIKSSATAQEAVDFINSMSRSLRTGEAIVVSDAINVDTNELSIKQQKIGDFDVSYFEDDNEFKKLVKEGLVENNYDINKISGEVVAVHQPDNMFVGTLKNLDKEIFNGNGGVFYTSITGNVWASGAESSAKSLAKLINKSLAESTDGVGRLVLVRGTDSKMISSTEGVKASMSIIELLVDKGLINRSEFRSSLIRAGKKFNIDFSGKDSSAEIHKDIKEKFMDVKNSTFQKRGDFFDEVINDLAKTSKSATENIDGIRKALGSKRKISFSKEGIRDSIGDILTERLLKDLPTSYSYAIIEVTEPVTYRENKGHDSYPWILESKSKPKLKLLSDRNHAVKDGVFEMIDGSVVTQGKLGLAQRGMGIAKISEQPSKIKQQKGITPENSSNYANLTEDDKGNFVFFHVGKNNYDVIKRSSGGTLVTSKEESRAIGKVGGLAMYYTSPESGESMVTGPSKYVVSVSPDKVYDFDSDPDNIIEEAKKRFNKEYPGQAFDTNTQLAYVTKIASEKGYDMTVAQWEDGTRAQTALELKPNDVQLSDGNTIVKQFEETYESNRKKGYKSVIPKSKYQRLKKLFDKINTERNKTSTYDALYRLAGEENKYSDSELSNLIMNSDISIEIKNEFQDILNYKPESRKSIKQQKTQLTTDKEAKPGYDAALEAIGETKEQRESWRRNNKVNQKQKRNPIVEQAAKDYYNELINQEEYLNIVSKNQPIKSFKEVPALPSLEDITNSLDTSKVATGIIGLTKNLEDGEKVASRLDIPAYEDYDTWVVSVHDGNKEGKSIAYGQTAVLKNVDFKTFPGPAIRIAMDTQNKSTIARMFGDWVNEDPEAVHARAKELMNDPAWTQVGMNPFRHSWFYDKTDGMPISSAEEVIQVGALVLAKNAKKISPSDPMFETKSSKGGKIKFQKTAQETRMDNESESVFKKSLDRGTTWLKATQNALDYIQKSKWYQNATDIEREQKVRDFKESKKQKLKKAPSVAKVLGKPKPNMVTVNEAAAFKDQLRLEAKAAREAKADLNSKRKSLSDAIKGMVKLGKLKVSQASTIIKRVSQVNLDNPVMVDRLIDYAAKVFERADYQERLDNAFSYRRAIKRLLKSDNQAQVVGMANEFAKIDPSMVENIDDYIAMAEIVKNAVAPSKIKGLDVVLKESANIEAVSNFSKDALEKQEQQLKAELLAINNDLLQSGVISGNMTIKEIQEILNAIKDPTYKMDSQEKERYIRSYLSKRFESLASIVTDIIKTNQNPFTGEKVAISEKNRAIISDLLKVDLSEMSIRDAIFAVEAMDNFINNGITSKLEGALSAYKGQLGLKQEIKSGKVARELKLYFSKKIGRYFATEFTPLPLMMERMFSGVKSGISVMRSMGLDLVINGVNKANYLHNKIINEYYEKFIKNSKTFHNPENVYERGMLSFLKRNVTGSLEEMKAETSRRIKMIQESIATLMNDGDESQKAMAEIYQKVFDKLGVSTGDIDVIDARASKENRDAVDWWVSEWSKHYQDLYDVSLSVYNYDLGSDVNYTPDRYKTIKTETFDQALTERNSSFLINMDHITDKGQTGVLMQANRPKVMPEGRYISLDFDTNNSSSLKGALVDINTAAGIRQVDGFLNSKLLSKLIPVSEDRSVLIQRTNRYIRRAKGKIFIPSDLYKDVDSALNFAASLGVGKALGGVLQSVKQTIPIAISTAINTGKFNMSSFEFNEWLNKTGMPISNRGIESLSTIESMDRRMEAKGTKFKDSLKWIQEKQQLYVKWFLSKPDVFIARSGFQSYYLQYMGEKSIDWANHTPNQDALNYAQAMVDRQQNISDPMLGGEFLTAEDGMKRMAKKILFPFASFGLNQKARLNSDIINMVSKTASAEDKKIAVKSALATITEMLAYRAISVGIGYGFYKSAAAIISGFIGDDDDDDKENDKKWLESATKFPLKSMVNDIVSPIQMTDRYVTMSTDFLLSLTTGDTEAELDELVKQENEIRSLKDQDPMTERQEEKFRQESKNKSLYQVGSKYDDNAGLGMISIASDLYKKIYDDYTLATTGEFQDDYKGNVTIKRIRPVEQDLMKNTLYFSALFAMGALPKESDQMVTKVVNMIKKNAMSESEYEKYEDFKKEFKREPSPFEIGLIKSDKKYDYISKDIDWVNRGGGLNLSQGREYVKLLNIMGEVNGSALLEIKAGKTADQISKSMRAKL